MSRKNYVLSTPGFVANTAVVDENTGRQVDWDATPTAFGAVGEKKLPAGTIVAEQADGTIVPRAGSALQASGILIAPAEEGNLADAKTGYGVYTGGIIYSNILPDRADAAFATMLTELRANGTGFVWQTYQDQRGN